MAAASVEMAAGANSAPTAELSSKPATAQQQQQAHVPLDASQDMADSPRGVDQVLSSTDMWLPGMPTAGAANMNMQQTLSQHQSSSQLVAPTASMAGLPRPEVEYTSALQRLAAAVSEVSCMWEELCMAQDGAGVGAGASSAQQVRPLASSSLLQLQLRYQRELGRAAGQLSMIAPPGEYGKSSGLIGMGVELG